jgi:3-deoxy-D-manno-octulosonate 8-phosphate phosphatase (KDO 8-P phosphatase)
MNEMHPKIFILDVDGVLTTGQIWYSKEGKKFKVFGPDDHDALNALRGKLKICFVTADKRGYPITHKRVAQEMKFDVELVHPTKRLEWIKNQENLADVIYMGDGIFDLPIFKEVGYAICPNNGFYRTKEAAHYVTQHNGGDRAVAEACLHVLEKFFADGTLEFNNQHGVWSA